MATLIVNASHNFTGEVLNATQPIDKIDYQNAATATATFASNQFGAGVNLIANNVLLDGNNQTNIIEVNLSAAGAFSAAGWQFLDWTSGTDQIRINGTAGDDTLTGTTLNDRIIGGNGVDTIRGGGGGDNLEGNAGNDVFIYPSAADIGPSESVNGGNDTDTLEVQGGIAVDFSSVSFVNLEQLRIAGSGATATITGLQIGDVGIGDLNAIIGFAGAQTLIVNSLLFSGVDMSETTFTSWTPGPDVVQINGAAGVSADVLIGSSQRDIINAGAGNDVITGGLGNDTIDGGADTDTADFNGSRAAYTVTKVSAGVQVVGPDGTDTVTLATENLSFDNGTFDPLIAVLGDILWRNTDGRVTTSHANLPNLGAEWSTTRTGDFNGDGDGDILWRHNQGNNVIWELQNGQFVAAHSLPSVNNSWSAVATGDFDGDGDSDILFRHTAGNNAIFEIQNHQFVASRTLPSLAPAFAVAGAGDFDADGDADILFRNSATGANVIWVIENNAFVASLNLPSVGNSYSVAGIGDFDDDDDADILFRHSGGGVSVVWEIENNAFVTNRNLIAVNNSFQVAGVEDFDSDGDGDILWRHDQGNLVRWDIENFALVQVHNIGIVSTAFQIKGTGEFDLL